MKKTNIQMSFSSHLVAKRTAKNTFYTHVLKLIDWQALDEQIATYYTPGKSATGKPAWSGLLLFKMLLLGVWNGNLSDRDVETMVCENLSAMMFCGLQLEDNVPDHSCLSRFRSQLAKNDGFQNLLAHINSQLENHHIVVKTGLKIDATITDSPRKPKGKATYQIAEDRKEDEVPDEEVNKQTTDIKAVKVVQPGVDVEARYVKKEDKLRYGYKNHACTDDNGLVLTLETTTANVHDSQVFETLLDGIEGIEEATVYADKAYKSAKHDSYLSTKKLKNSIHHKAVKGKPLTEEQKALNVEASRRRYTVERTFGGIKRWFRGGIARYVGLVKTHGQHLLEAIAYNLKRMPRLYMEAQCLLTAGEAKYLLTA